MTNPVLGSQPGHPRAQQRDSTVSSLVLEVFGFDFAGFYGEFIGEI